MFGWLKRLLNGGFKKNGTGAAKGVPKEGEPAHDPLTDTQFMRVVDDVHRRIQTKIQACRDVLEAQLGKGEDRPD